MTPPVGKIGTRHEAQEIAAPGVGVLDEMQRRIAELGRIVRRNGGRHADRDALRAVGEKVWERARQHHRLFFRAVIGRAEIDRVLVDAVDQEPGDLGEARLGVAHRGGIIAVDIAEIALAVDQRIALGEFLREAHQRVIDRLVAMRVELADDVADDAGAFLEAGAGFEPQLPHRMKEPPVHRLEAVARIGQRAMHDGGERIGKVALFQRVAQGDVLDAGQLGNQWRDHPGSIQNAGGPDNARVSPRLAHDWPAIARVARGSRADGGSRRPPSAGAEPPTRFAAFGPRPR